MSPHSQPAGQALTPTHPQALQVTAEARALHVDEGLGEKHEGDVRAPGGTGAGPGAAGSTPHLYGLMDPPSPKPLHPRGHPPACRSWRRVLAVLEGRVVQGVPSAPCLGHPGTEERARFGGAAKLGLRGRGGTFRPPTPALTFSPFWPGSPGIPGNPGGPISPCRGEQRGVSRRQGKGVAVPHHPATPHLTYGFAVLARISLGMAERGQVSVQVGRVGGQGTPPGEESTHRLAVSARGSVFPRWPGGAGDLLHHRAISVLREGPGWSRVTWLSFLSLRARVAKSSTALGRGGEGGGGGWQVPEAAARAGHGSVPAPPAMLTLTPRSPFSP